MAELTKIQYRALACAAHHLKPVAQIGKEGLSAAAMQSIFEAFNTRELIKVKALETCPDSRGILSEKLAALPDVTLIRNIGHVYILYRPLPPEEEKPASKPVPRKAVAKKTAARPARRPVANRSEAGEKGFRKRAK